MSRDAAGSETGHLAQPEHDAGVDVECIALLHQHPVDGLLHIANRRHADEIVIGSRGAGGFDDLELGGTATKILRRSPLTPVLIPSG